MHILVTGGAGYIGSHTTLELLQAGHSVTVIDNFSNSKETSLARVQELAGRTLSFLELDLLDKDVLGSVFAHRVVDAVIHFAGIKAVGESVAIPLDYYRTNVTATLNLCCAMVLAGVKNLVFSSSSTIYGDPRKVPVTEEAPLNPTNPYGRSKLMVEMILRDLHHSDPEWNIVLLRYFNPVGAHPSGRIGEDPNGIPSNLFPYLTQTAVGRREYLSIFGTDYSTRDGTAIRDYIHVVDVAVGHQRALEKLGHRQGVTTYNLGTGQGYSVLEVITAFENVIGRQIPCRVADRRPGDAAECYADPSRAEAELGWRAEHSLKEMCTDAWRWQSVNPNGYD